MLAMCLSGGVVVVGDVGVKMGCGGRKGDWRNGGQEQTKFQNSFDFLGELLGQDSVGIGPRCYKKFLRVL